MFFRTSKEKYVRSLNLKNRHKKRFLYLIKEPCSNVVKVYLWIIFTLLGIIYFLLTEEIYGAVLGFVTGIPAWLMAERLRGFYKIGITKNLKRRLTAINNGNARTVYYIYYRMTDDVQKVETEVHRKLKKVRKDGEWFHLWIWQVWWLKWKYFRGSD